MVELVRRKGFRPAASWLWRIFLANQPGAVPAGIVRPPGRVTQSEGLVDDVRGKKDARAGGNISSEAEVCLAMMYVSQRGCNRDRVIMELILEVGREVFVVETK